MKQLVGAPMIFALILLMGAVVGCSNSMQAGTASGHSGQTPFEASIDVDLNKIQQETAEGEATIRQAIVEVEGIVNPDGSINVSAGSSSPGTVQPQVISLPLDLVFNRVLAAVDKVRGIVDAARAKAMEARLKLDVNKPEHAAAILKLDLLMSNLDMAEAAFDAVLLILSTKVEQVVVKIDAYRSKLDLTKTRDILIYTAISPVRASVMRFIQGLRTY